MKRSTKGCKKASVPLVVRTESQETFNFSNRFGYWILAHSWCFSWICLNSILTNNVTQERHMLLEKLTIKQIDFQVCAFEALEDLSNSRNVFIGGTRKETKTIWIKNCAFPSKANEDQFHKRLEKGMTACETHWHNEPLEITIGSTESCLILTSWF